MDILSMLAFLLSRGFKMLSKVTINYANKRGLDVSNEAFPENGMRNNLPLNGNFINYIWIWCAKDDNEPLCSYISNSDGSFTWSGNVWLHKDIKEELPYYIENEKALRGVLDYISKERAIIEAREISLELFN